MGKRVRVFLDQEALAVLAPARSGGLSSANQTNSKRPNQVCFFCDLLDCRQVEQNGKKLKVGAVRIFGKEVSIVYSPQEGCWLPSL